MDQLFGTADLIAETVSEAGQPIQAVVSQPAAASA